MRCYRVRKLIASLILTYVAVNAFCPVLNTNTPSNTCTKPSGLGSPSRYGRWKWNGLLAKGGRGEDDDSEGSVPFKTGSHTYASWKQSGSTVDEEVSDVEIDDSDDEPEPSNILLESIRKVYNAIFFYGLDTPTRTRSRRLKNKKQKKKSLFFTPGEQFSQELIVNPSEHEYEEERASPAVRRSVRSIEGDMSKVADELAVLEVSLTMLREDDDDEHSAEIARKESMRDKLLERSEALQIELVSALAVDE